jgi:hypothetical protein
MKHDLQLVCAGRFCAKHDSMQISPAAFSGPWLPQAGSITLDCQAMMKAL